MNRGPDSLPPDLEHLLVSARAIPAPSHEIEERVLARVRATVALGALGGGGGGSGGEGGAEAASKSVGSAGSGSSSVLSTPLAKTIATFVFGAAVGAGAHAGLERRPLVEVYGPSAIQSTPILALQTVPDAPSAAHVASEPSVASLPNPLAIVRSDLVRPASIEAKTLAPTHDAGPHRDTDFAAERALLELARTALARGQPGAGLVALERHEHEFSHGQLAEERESLWIQALVGTGAYASARTRAEAFRARFPRSIFLPVVDHVLRSIP